MISLPFDIDFSGLNDNQLEEKIQELTKKYWTAQRLGKPEMLTQIANFITLYKEELSIRQKKKMKSELGGDLEQLINVE
jgi:hypothetical protein